MSKGIHVVMDCYDCDEERMDDMEHIYRVLDTIPNMLDMTKIIPPYVFPYCGKVPEDRGVTGVVIIAESHITIHTFVERGYMFCDIFSCIAFDPSDTVDYVVEQFGVKHCRKVEIDRGI